VYYYFFYRYYNYCLLLPLLFLQLLLLLLRLQLLLLPMKTRLKFTTHVYTVAACTRLAVLVLRCQHGPAAMICRGGRYERTSGWVECGNVVVVAAAASGGTRPRAHTRTSHGRRAVERCARPAGEWVNGTTCGRARPPWWPGGRSYELYGRAVRRRTGRQRTAAANSYYRSVLVIIMV